MALRKHKSELMGTLRRHGFPLTFADLPVCDYTCSQLRGLLNLFDPTALDQCIWPKIEYCELLLELKPTLTQREFTAARLIAAGYSLQDARNALTTFQQGPAPVARDIDSEIPESQSNATLDQHDSPISRLFRTCAACVQLMPVTRFPRVCTDGACNHSSFNLCSDCFAHYITSQSETFALDAIPCPEIACGGLLSYQMMQENASILLFERYETVVNSRAITSAADYLECSNPACPSGGIIDESSMTYMVCDGCQTSTCLTCRTAWHPGMSHEDNQAAVRAAKAPGSDQQAQQDRRTTQYLRRLTKPCPQCGVAISKNLGCDHMTW